MKRHTQTGVVLLESLIAILIFVVGIIALVSLQAASMRNTTQSQFRIEASIVANQRLGRIWADIPNMTGYAEASPGTNIVSLPDGKRTTAVVGSLVTITVSWKPPEEATRSTYKINARVETNPIP